MLIVRISGLVTRVVSNLINSKRRPRPGKHEMLALAGSLDHSIRTQQDGLRNGDAQCLGGLQDPLSAALHPATGPWRSPRGLHRRGLATAPPVVPRPTPPMSLRSSCQPPCPSAILYARTVFRASGNPRRIRRPL